jgi:N-acyl-D-aspartate/D-glutamate deacylase
MLKNLFGGLLFSSLIFSFSSMSMADIPPKYDLVLTNGTIVDGTGSARFDGDIGIKDGRIVAVGDLASEESSKTVDITGQVVAPGFIDVHGHADRAFGSPETAGIPGFLKQGVTTAVYGVDGGVSLDDLQRYIALADSGGIGINFMSYIGHNGVRAAVIGMDGRPPTMSWGRLGCLFRAVVAGRRPSGRHAAALVCRNPHRFFTWAQWSQ